MLQESDAAASSVPPFSTTTLLRTLLRVKPSKDIEMQARFHKVGSNKQGNGCSSCRKCGGQKKKNRVRVKLPAVYK